MKFDLFSIIIIIIVAIVGSYAIYIQIKTKRIGIETDATVTDVKKEWERTGDDDFLSYYYTIEYVNYEGKKVSAVLGGLTNSSKNLDVGDHIRVKYLKNKQDYPIMIKKI